MWHFSDSIATTLKKFTGEIIPSNPVGGKLKDSRRWYLDELPKKDVNELIDYFSKNRALILSDILKGRGFFAAEWFLVTKNENSNYSWVLKNINDVINYFSQGEVKVSERGGLIFCKLTIQRKGGTPDPTSLQFKIKPLDLFE